ncbi:MAG: thermonuclease family protein [Pseudomonadota bacterium]
MIRNRVWMICFILFACARDAPLPDMQPGETGRVTKVIDGDGLILDTGQRVRLISIVAPVLSPPEGAPEPHSGESARLLEDMTLGRRVQLFYPGLTRDRYDRALAHVVTIDSAGPRLWLNHEMVAQGAARVRLFASTAARGQDLLEAERTARDEALGVWALSEYAPRAVNTFDVSNRGFKMVTATLGDMAPRLEDDRFAPGCRRRLQDTQITLRVDRDTMSVCGMANGTQVELRGWLADGEIRLQHPLHVTLQRGP